MKSRDFCYQQQTLSVISISPNIPVCHLFGKCQGRSLQWATSALSVWVKSVNHWQDSCDSVFSCHGPSPAVDTPLVSLPSCTFPQLILKPKRNAGYTHVSNVFCHINPVSSQIYIWLSFRRCASRGWPTFIEIKKMILKSAFQLVQWHCCSCGYE